MELLRRITNKDILGTDEITEAEVQEAVRVVLLDDNDMAAVMYIKNWNFYMLPGGRMEEGETVSQALEREILEETGCSMEVLHELGTVDENRGLDGFILYSYCFLAKVIGEKGTPSMTQEEIDSGTEVQWHSLPRVMELIKNQQVNESFKKFIIERETTLLHEAIRHRAGQ